MKLYLSSDCRRQFLLYCDNFIDLLFMFSLFLSLVLDVKVLSGALPRLDLWAALGTNNALFSTDGNRFLRKFFQAVFVEPKFWVPKYMGAFYKILVFETCF